MSQPNEANDRLDYLETSDVTEVHASVVREHGEPRAGTMPIPMWLGVLCAGALTWAGAYVGMFHGGFSGKVFNEYTSTPADFFPLKQSGQDAGAAVELSLFDLGAKKYAACAACHGTDGRGTGANPPLAGSEWVDGSEYSDKRLIAILLKGLKGPVTVKGATYNGLMPAWGTSLKPREIAGVATYIRQSFGNAGTGEITEAQVNAAKKLFADKIGEWTIEEIKAMPVTDTLEGGAPAAGDTPVAATTTPAAAPAVGGFDLAESVKRGQSHYVATCMACHQMNGQGLPGAFPPLANQDWVTGDPRRLVAITLKGIMGAMTVDGKVYATGMPSPVLTYPQLKDDKNLADVLNYVRNSFGNKSDMPITPEFVGKVRAEFASDTVPFSEETLKNFK